MMFVAYLTVIVAGLAVMLALALWHG